MRSLQIAGLLLLCIAGIVQSANLLHAPSPTRPVSSNDVIAFILQNPTTATLSARYITFGHPFFVAQFSLGGKNSTILTAYKTSDSTVTYQVQVDAKAFHADGSVRQATLTMLAPSLTAGQSITIMLTRTMTAVTPLSIQSVPTTLTAKISSIAGSSATYTFDASSLVKGVSTPDLWLSGNLAVQARVQKWVMKAMRVVFDVTLYKDNSWCVDAIFANDIAMGPVGGDVSYTATITSTPLTKSYSVSPHYQYQGWHKLVCSAGDSNFNVQYDQLQLIQSRVLIPINYTIGVYDTSILDQNTEMQSATWGTPLSANGVEMGMPETGDRRDIGWLAGPHSNWFVSQDWNAKKYMMGWGDASHAVPWNYYVNTTGRYVNYWDYPNIWIDYRGTPQPPQLMDDASGWQPDQSHSPSLAALPYVISGQRYYLDLVKAVAAWQICVIWNYGRSNYQDINYITQDKGLMTPYNQERGMAWGMRDVGHAAYLSDPADVFHKTYFNSVINSNLDFIYHNETVRMQALQGATYGYYFGVYGTGTHPPWQDDYLSSTFAMLYFQGFNFAQNIMTWMRNFQVMSFFATDWNNWNRIAYIIGPGPTNNGSIICKTYSCLNTYTALLNQTVDTSKLGQLGGDFGQLARQTFILYQGVFPGDTDALKAQQKIDTNNVQNCDIESFRNDPRWNSGVFPNPTAPTTTAATTTHATTAATTAATTTHATTAATTTTHATTAAVTTAATSTHATTATTVATTTHATTATTATTSTHATTAATTTTHVTTAATTTISTTTGAGAGIIPNGMYQIVHSDFNLALSLYNYYTDDGTPLIQTGVGAGGDQAFYATHLGSNYYTFANYNTHKCIDVSYLGDLATLQQITCSGADRQKWLVTRYSTGVYYITNKASGFVMMPQHCYNYDQLLAITAVYEAYCQFWKLTPSSLSW